MPPWQQRLRQLAVRKQPPDDAQTREGARRNIGRHYDLSNELFALFLDETMTYSAALFGTAADGSPGTPIASEPLLAPHLREDLRTLTFGEGADVRLVERLADGRVRILHGDVEIELWPSFAQAHNLRNLLAAVAAARALGITPAGRVEVSFSAMRGQRRALAGGIVLIDDCYNANPMSMRAAIDELAETALGRRVAVLGDMLELGRQAPRLHREIGAHARRRGVQLLVTVGPLAAEMGGAFAGEAGGAFAGEAHAVGDARAAAQLLGGLLREGDTILVKGSRGVGLERVADALADASGPAQEHVGADPLLAPSAAPGRR